MSDTYASVSCTRRQYDTPFGKRYEVEMTWKGDPRLPVLVDQSIEKEWLEWAPWPLVKAGETWLCTSVYYRRDTNPYGAVLWRARQSLQQRWRYVAIRIAWTCLVWGIAIPHHDARQRLWPIRRWAWQKDGRASQKKESS